MAGARPLKLVTIKSLKMKSNKFKVMLKTTNKTSKKRKKQKTSRHLPRSSFFEGNFPDTVVFFLQFDSIFKIACRIISKPLKWPNARRNSATLLKKWNKLFSQEIQHFVINKWCLHGSKNSHKMGLKKCLLDRSSPFSIIFLVWWPTFLW